MAKQTVRIYHNPRCGKSRETLALLRARGIEPEVIEYLKTPPRAADVKMLVRQLGIDAHALLRSKEDAYRTMALSTSSSMDEIARAIEQEPILMERPIVVVGDRAALGRPPENVLALL